MPVARLWSVRIDPARAQDYLRFIHERSLPMFRTQEGYQGVLFLGADDERTVITLWQSMDSVEALNSSPVYQTVVKAIQDAGFIRGEARLTVHTVELSDFR